MAVAAKQSSDLYIGPAPKELVDRILYELEPQVEKALAYSFDLYSMIDLSHAIKANDMQLWNAIENGKLIGIEITQIVKYPQKTVCDLFLTAGTRMTVWSKPMLMMIEAFAKNQGAELIFGRGRKGWVKLAEKYGFDKPFMASAKVI